MALWEQQTGTPFDPIVSAKTVVNRTVTCPNCLADVPVRAYAFFDDPLAVFLTCCVSIHDG